MDWKRQKLCKKNGIRNKTKKKKNREVSMFTNWIETEKKNPYTTATNDWKVRKMYHFLVDLKHVRCGLTQWFNVLVVKIIWFHLFSLYICDFRVCIKRARVAEVLVGVYECVCFCLIYAVFLMLLDRTHSVNVLSQWFTLLCIHICEPFLDLYPFRLHSKVYAIHSVT